MLATSITTLIAIASFSFITSLTPGINNLMLANSGANFGMQKTLPMLMGCSIGLMMIMLLVAFGAGQVFIALPWLKQALLYTCSAYLMYLGYQLAFAKNKQDNITVTNPISFVQAILIQFINPGIWILAIAAMGFSGQMGSDTTSLLVISILVTLVNLPAIAIWAISGSAMNSLLKHPRNNRIFKHSLSAMTLLTIPMLWLSN